MNEYPESAGGDVALQVQGRALLRDVLEQLQAGVPLTDSLRAMLLRAQSRLDVQSLELHVEIGGATYVHEICGVSLADRLPAEQAESCALLLSCLRRCLFSDAGRCLEAYDDHRTGGGGLWWGSGAELREMSERERSAPCLKKLAGWLPDGGGVFVPICSGHDVFGTLIAFDRRPRRMCVGMVSVLEDFAQGVLLAIQQSQARDRMRLLAAAIEQSSEATVITDIKGDIEYVNPAFEESTGYAAAEAIGRNPRFMQSGKQSEAYYADLWQTLGRGEVWHGLFFNKRKDGSLLEEKVTIFPVRDELGCIKNYVANKRDLTRESALEAQLRQSQKMEAVGLLAGGIAHDFNNLLTSIIGFSELSMNSLVPGSQAYGDLQEVMNSAERATRLTTQLLALSRKQLSAIGPMDLNETVRSMGQLLRRMIGENIKLSLDLSSDLPIIVGDAGGIEQILLNLAVNARDAMPEGGSLKITTSLEKVADDDPRAPAGLAGGDYVCLTVGDTGVGMSPEVQDRVFEPFFTTKGEDKGTGLGLSIVQGIMQQLRGFVALYSQPGVGTTFHLFFPVANAELTMSAGSEQMELAGGSESILVVEDDATLRHLSLRMLPALGYRVTAAANGVEALHLLEVNGAADYDLVFTDLVMPEMGGIELAQRVQALCPELRVLFTTGFSHELDNALRKGSSQIQILLKPYTKAELARKIRATLDAG
jgi:two-component system, cell cycle sensor histidine kinase and response regulator CckA